jgi:hypothetical protein
MVCVGYLMIKYGYYMILMGIPTCLGGYLMIETGYLLILVGIVKSLWGIC